MAGWLVVALVVEPTRSAILVESADAGTVRLPSLELASGEGPLATAIEAVGERLLGEPVVPVRIWLRENDDDESGSIIVLTEPVTSVRDRRHVSLDDLRAAIEAGTLEPAEARDAAGAWLEILDAPPDPRTSPWTRPGWFARASDWVADQLASAGHPATEPTRFQNLSPLGAILRARSSDRSFFLKCSAPYFQAEPRIVAALARRTPDLVPEVIAIEPDEGWLLMGDVGGRILGRQPEATWPEAMPRIAALQGAWAGHTGELAAAGAQVRPLGALADAIPGFLDREGLGNRLDADVRTRWLEALPGLVDACRRLEAIGLPDALIHGDLHPWNVALNDDGLRVFDWSDGAIGPSFVDLPVFIVRAKEPEVRVRLRKAYLDGWTDLMARDRLEAAAELAMTVGALYQVETYLGLVPGLEPLDGRIFASSDARWLKRALDAADVHADVR
jgi:hypothetical protein